MIHNHEPLIDPRRWNWLSKRGYFSMAGVTVIILLLAGFVDVNLSSKPGLCKSCHEIQPLYEEWKTS